MCDGSDHNLKVIYHSGDESEMAVVRWCRDCGAVAVDLEFDGRCRPGGIQKMEFPTGNRTK